MININKMKTLKNECEDKIQELREEESDIREELELIRTKKIVYDSCLDGRYSEYYERQLKKLEEEEENLNENYNEKIEPIIKRLEYELNVINENISKLS